MGIRTGRFLVGDMDRPFSLWGYGSATFELTIWTSRFPVEDMDRPISPWGYGPPFPVGEMHRALSS